MSQTFGPTSEADNNQRTYYSDHRIVSGIPVDIYWWHFPPYTLLNDARDVIYGANETDQQGLVTTVLIEAITFCMPEHRDKPARDFLT